MTAAEVIRAAKALTPVERAHVAEVLWGIDEVDQSEVEAAWARVSTERFERVRRGLARTFTREEAEAHLDARLAAKEA